MAENLTTEEKALEAVVLARLMHLDVLIHGLVFGIVSGLLIFIATNWLVLKGGALVGPNLSLLGQFFIGYDVTFKGSVVGFLYGFLSGFIVGASIAVIYNWLNDIRYKRFSRKS